MSFKFEFKLSFTGDTNWSMCLLICFSNLRSIHKDKWNSLSNTLSSKLNILMLKMKQYRWEYEKVCYISTILLLYFDMLSFLYPLIITRFSCFNFNFVILHTCIHHLTIVYWVSDLYTYKQWPEKPSVNLI